MDKELKDTLKDIARSHDVFQRDENLRTPEEKAARCVANFSPCERRRKSSDNTCMHYPDPDYLSLEDWKMNFRETLLKNETDSRIKFRRVSDNSIYCVMNPNTVARHRKAGTLESFLKTQLDSGIVIRTFKD